MRPILTLSSVAVWNYSTLIPVVAEDALNLENIEILQTFTGTSSESGFYRIAVAIEARSAIILPLLLSCLRAVRDRDPPKLIRDLRSIATEIARIESLLRKLHSECSPAVFYDSIRLYLSGWKNSSLLPKGVIYEGTSRCLASSSHPIEWKTGYRSYFGGSNAQSPLVQALDIVLGIEHRHRRNEPSECGGFITNMREYMPGPHRRFLEDLNRVSDLRDYVQRHPTGEVEGELRDAYNACIVGMRRFRDTHLQIVSRYIILPGAKVGKQCPRAAMGTGGTPVVSFLKHVRQETIAAATFKPLPIVTQRQPDWKVRVPVGPWIVVLLMYVLGFIAFILMYPQITVYPGEKG